VTGIFEASSADPDSATPVWVDLTPYVNDVVSTPTLTTGRQNDLDQAEPSELQALLNNADDRFTFGNPLSPYAAWWGPGRKCRYRETIGGVTVPLFVGYLQTPTEGLVTAGIDQRVGISALDRLGRLGSAPTFVSTIGAGIGGPALKAHYPLGERDGRRFLDVTGNLPPLVLTEQIFINSGTYVAYPDQLRLGLGDAPPGDDLDPLLFEPHHTLGVIDGYTWLKGVLPTPIVVGTTDWLTITAWLRPHAVNDGNFHIAVELTTSAGDDFSIQISTAGFWQGFMYVNGTSLLITGPYAGADVSTLVSFRVNLSTAVAELRVGSVLTSDTWGGVPSGALSIANLRVGEYWDGAMSHIQVYAGSSSSFDSSAHAAQYAAGIFGLERQTTGDRIRTILQYAGVPAAEYASTVDKGQSVMQAALLAGQTPLDAMRDAERTEQGLLYVDGSGNLVFKDRRTLYNI
jgi:hypothetical protein